MSKAGGYAAFLHAREAIDARSRHERVWQCALSHLARASPDRPVRILELGAGVGGLLRDLLLVFKGPLLEYEVIEEEKGHLSELAKTIEAFAQVVGFQIVPSRAGWQLQRGTQQITVRVREGDVWDILRNERPRQADLVIAQAFLDLFDVSALLPLIVRQAGSGGGLYFPITFDGVTTWLPEYDSALDAAVERFYHETMDSRRTPGERMRRSHAGRSVLAWLATCPDIADWDAGGSDWLVGGRPDDPAAGGVRAFLHAMLDGYAREGELAPERAPAGLNEWIARRRRQVEDDLAILMTHQLDIYARTHISERAAGRDDA